MQWEFYKVYLNAKSLRGLPLFIFSVALLSSVLAFKGGTATMFFHNLPRFSTDLDFNLLDAEKETEVYDRVRKIVLKYGITWASKCALW